MNFSNALDLCLYHGAKITRSDWNGKEMYVYYTPGRYVFLKDWEGEITKTEELKGAVKICGHLDMYNAQGERIIGWSPTQTDMYSEKWKIYDAQEGF